MADQSYQKIQQLVKEKPELGTTVSDKLASLLDELEVSGSEPKSNIDNLHHGFNHFKKHVYGKNTELTDKLKTGQWPKYMVIACADSRVDPAITLKLKPGDAFIIRNVANMVPPFESEGYPSVGSALEYAVLHLKVEHIVVVGHSACGGIGALIKMVPEDGNYATTFIERWVEIGKPARKEVNAESPNGAVADLCKTCEKTSVKNSLNNLLTYPFVVEAAKSKKITIHGGYYDFINGAFDTWDFEVPAEKAV